MKHLLKVIMILGLVFSIGCTKEKDKTDAISDEERMEWWTEARFGMFIHWGIYSVPAGVYKGKVQRNSAEWIMNRGKIPIAEYEKFAEQFNPSKFNAEEFVGLAKEAGMKYMVITAKHHDGFSMFHSKSNPYNVVDATPLKRDVMKELAEACQKQGIKFGFYYSQSQDWHHPGGMGNNWDKTLKKVSSDEYLHKKALPEVNQLLTDYGPIGIFWWDTPRKMSKEIVDSLYRVTTDLQPSIITNDRLGDEYPGDYKTYERHLPKFKPDAKYWEICQPISASWGYKSSDKDFKSIPVLIRNLIHASSMGGNYLLNVSPTAEGKLVPESVERLKAVGKWLKANNEAIYGTQASPCGQPDWGRITMKSTDDGTTLYLHVYDWQENAQLPVQIRNDAENCYLLTDKSRKFNTETREDGLWMTITGTAPDSVASVFVLKLAEKPDVIPPKPFGQNEQGIVAFYNERAQFQNLHGPSARYNSSKDCVGKWKSETAEVYWTFVIENPGTFHITSESAGKANSEFTVELAGQTKNVKISATGRDDVFKSLEIGNFEIKEPGNYKITFTPVAGAWKPVNFRNVVLTPVQKEIAQPNIVVFLCDDLGYGDLSSYGHPTIETPNLDKLASSGIRCTDFYSAAPVCSPSRAGLLTGRSPNRAGIYDWIPSAGKSKDLRDLVHLQQQEETIPAILKTAGYATCLVGKWHCNSRFNSDKQPQPDHFGFDHWLATQNNAAPSHKNPINFVRNGEEVGEIEGFSCQIIVDEALEWLKKKKRNNPFYLQVSFHEPHVPIESPQPLVEKYLPFAKNENEAQFFANVENVDKAVGRLVNYLEKNHNENTLVIFTSDNGPETLLRYKRAKRSYGSPGALKGMKLWTHEAGFRVPGIIYWMGKSTFTGTSDAVISSLDFLPTFVEISGADLPQNPIDGESFTSLFTDGKFERSKPLLWAFYNALNDHIIAMRSEDWKIMARLKNDTTYVRKIKNIYDGNEALIKESELTDLVLYNLKSDMSETEDIATKSPEFFEKMKKLLDEEYGKLLADSHVWVRKDSALTTEE